ncbi:uncharacterized protein LY89DRAFT_450913 [Mollisia scopiformis]|uniref:Uncharacterized protein n=1 Tax=Mollisia scopiformis TaxID=149040 RepID=A0A194XKI3_MOLSC|nr:uncharacterized protein LY89DRAFT_450913 [Mollisia scopiformis]KUJ20651.1 hypothetical protein LY89DRAFT_450913 [Mollisia scopiformis]
MDGLLGQGAFLSWGLFVIRTWIKRRYQGRDCFPLGIFLSCQKKLVSEKTPFHSTRKRGNEG